MSVLATSNETILHQRLSALHDWDLTKVKQKVMQTENIDEENANRLEAEYKRYIELHTRYPKAILPMSAPVDPFWHNHLLFSKDYAEMCQTVAGKFIHHQPITTEDERKALAPHYLQNTLPLYEKHFGSPSPDMWAIDAVVCGYNGDCA